MDFTSGGDNKCRTRQEKQNTTKSDFCALRNHMHAKNMFLTETWCNLDETATIGDYVRELNGQECMSHGL